VSLSTRLVDSPAIIVGHESAAMRRMMGMMEAGKAPELTPQKLEVNASHPIIVRLAAARAVQPELARRVAQQLFDNALVSAGLMDDPRSMVANMHAIMAESLKLPPTETKPAVEEEKTKPKAKKPTAAATKKAAAEAAADDEQPADETTKPKAEKPTAAATKKAAAAAKKS